MEKTRLRLNPSQTAALLPSDIEDCFYSTQGREKFFSKMAEAVPDALFLYDIPQKSCLYTNPQFWIALGMTEGAIEDLQPTLFYCLLHQEDFLLFTEHIEKCTAMADGAVFGAEYRFRHANGESRWFHYRDTVFTRDNDGMPSHMLCAAYDINDHKRNEEALRNQEVQNALVRLISLVSYEINTPLANIKNILFLLRTSASDQSDIRFLQWMEEEIERLARIPRSLLTLPVANS